MTDKFDINFIAIDFKTATSERTSICKVGIYVVRNGEIAETHSWLVHPEDNRYQYWNIKVHGIRSQDTENVPDFRQIWEEIERPYLDESDTFVMHNVHFNNNCLLHSPELFRIHLPELKWICSLQMARKVYSFKCNPLDYLYEQLGIEQGTHHCAGDDAEMCTLIYEKVERYL